VISPISSSIKPFFFSPYHSLIGIFVPFYLIFMICAWLQLLHDDLGHLKQPLTDLYQTPQSKFVVCSWLKVLDSRVFIFSVHKKYFTEVESLLKHVPDWKCSTRTASWCHCIPGLSSCRTRTASRSSCPCPTWSDRETPQVFKKCLFLWIDKFCFVRIY